MNLQTSLRYFGTVEPVFARSGWEIPQPNLLLLKESGLPQDLVRIRTQALVDDMLRKGRSNINIRSVSAHLYDCVGMAFANRRAWIDVVHLVDILREDGYSRIELEQVVTGDIVVYARDARPEHVGVITQVHSSLGQIPQMRVLSKWGRLGEVEHNLADVPEMLGVPDSLWSERVR